jgi:hypothetical protein
MRKLEIAPRFAYGIEEFPASFPPGAMPRSLWLKHVTRGGGGALTPIGTPIFSVVAAAY